jgi:hypothetical protein
MTKHRKHPMDLSFHDHSYRFRSIKVCLALLIVLAVSASAVRAAGAKTGPSKPLPPGVSDRILHVKYREGTVGNPNKPPLPLDVDQAVSKVRPLFTIPKGKLDDLRKHGKQATGQDLPDLSLWYRLQLKPTANAADVLQELQQQPYVEAAQAAPLPAPLPTPSFVSSQTYLNPATTGINASYAWGSPGGAGGGVTIYDVEYSWNQSHEDLDAAAAAPILVNGGDVAVDPFSNNNHGTAVLGEMIATNDGLGVTGIAYNADIKLAPAYTLNLGYDPANAIGQATLDAQPGDVILIEQQAVVCNVANYGPVEWVAPVFDAIQTATANGIVVVEAAGNGGFNLDSAACGGWFSRSHDSGAIIVGAGQPLSSGFDRQIETFSDYGQRVDVQGQGDSVVTTGWYGDLYNGGNPNAWYTDSFNGTSSASPIVAGAAADIEGIAKAQRVDALSPYAVRYLLTRTGSPQLGQTSHHIGPRLNLQTAIDTVNYPRATAPKPGAVITNGLPRFRWQGMSNFKDAFHVQVDDQSDFSSPAVDALTTKTGYVSTTTLPFGFYYWQIAALNWDAGTFMVTPLKSPANHAKVYTDRPRFTWASIPGATQYEIQIDDDQNFGSLEINAYPTTPYYQVPSDQALQMGNYFWHIRQYAPTAAPTFVPNFDLEYTLLKTPKDGLAVATGAPKLAWNKVPGATQYTVQIDTSPACGPSNTYTTSDNFLAPSPALDYGLYYWCVQASGGVITPLTLPFSLYVTNMVSPGPGAAVLNRLPVFKWKAVQGAAYYELQVATDSGFSSMVFDTGGPPSLTTSSYTLPIQLTPGQTYYWRILTDTGITMPFWSLIIS